MNSTFATWANGPQGQHAQRLLKSADAWLCLQAAFKAGQQTSSDPSGNATPVLNRDNDGHSTLASERSMDGAGSPEGAGRLPSLTTFPMVFRLLRRAPGEVLTDLEADALRLAWTYSEARAQAQSSEAELIATRKDRDNLLQIARDYEARARAADQADQSDACAALRQAISAVVAKYDDGFSPDRATLLIADLHAVLAKNPDATFAPNGPSQFLSTAK